MTGIAAIQTRMAELQALVAPEPAVLAASDAQFAATLADSLSSSRTGGSAAGTGLPTTGPTANIAPGSGVSAQDLVAAAEKYTGTPYVWGGESLSEGGLDCSGLVLRSLTDLGIGSGIPRVAHDQQNLGVKVDSLEHALPGDLLVFGGGSHIAIYVGEGKMVDAPKPGGKVGVRDVWAEPTNIRRILPQEGAGSALGGVADTTAAARAAWQILSGIGTSAAGSSASSSPATLLGGYSSALGGVSATDLASLSSLVGGAA